MGQKGISTVSSAPYTWEYRMGKDKGMEGLAAAMASMNGAVEGQGQKKISTDSLE